jgi:hypothetical protein
MTALNFLFDILDLFSDFFDFTFNFKNFVCDLDIIGFGTDRIRFTVHFLHQKIQLFPIRLIALGNNAV